MAQNLQRSVGQSAAALLGDGDTDEQALSRMLEERNAILKDIPYETVRKAWFTLSHLLLDDGSHVLDMGCGDGTMAFAMAALNPHIRITAIDKSKRSMSKAREVYKLHNLEFLAGDACGEMFEPGTIDAIINSYVLHEIYSGSRYSERIVSDALRRQFRMLKVGGTMFIRDYARPPPEEFVIMEIPGKPSTGPEMKNLSEADLLVWYSEHARPRQDPGCGGFFLEELPARFPNTRLFRLPYKWAYEFIMRKDDRAQWETELPMEYTFFTPREFRKELRALGARVLYSAPYWDEDIIDKKFEGHFRLYEDDGTPIGHPATCYIAVAQKMSERKSLHIEERRPSIGADGSLQISAMRNEKTGEIVDIVTRGLEIGEILPYHLDEDGRLKIYLHDGVARGITNAVPRSGINLDGKRWSGHMVETIAFNLDILQGAQEFDVKATALFARDHLGLKPRSNATLEHGQDFYPAPDFIDERVHTYYLNVEKSTRDLMPKTWIGYSPRFQAKGKIRELDAQHVLNAIAVGLVPNARLELQILSLFQHLGLRTENWTAKDISFQLGEIVDKADVRHLLKDLSQNQEYFRTIKGTKGDLRTVHSIFVEEGVSQGSTTGLSSQDLDFVVTENKSNNIAIVLPLTEDLKGNVHAGFQLKHLPVPQRHEGQSLAISAPTFDLPPNITNMQMARKFIADKFGVLPDMVIKMGESYHSHIGMTSQRIYPFAVAAPPNKLKDPGTKYLPLYQFALLWRSLSREPHFMLTIARAYRALQGHAKLDYKMRVKNIVQQRFAAAKPDFSLPEVYVPPVSSDKIEKQEFEKKKAFHEQEPEQNPVVKITPKEEMRLAETFEQEIEDVVKAIKEYHDQGPKPDKW